MERETVSDNLVLEHLRYIRGGIDVLRDDMRDTKHRLTTLELQVANLASTQAGNYASVSIRLDRVEDRLDRIERRLEIVPAG